MAVTNTGIVERNITGVNESDLWLDTEATSSVSNTGAVERSITGVHDANFVRPLGDELIANGDFSNGAADWVDVDGSATFEDGSLKIQSNGTTLNRVLQSSVTEAGKSYKLTYEVKENNAVSTFRYYNGAAYVGVSASVGTHSESFVAGSNSGFFLSVTDTDVNSYIVLDNFSVKEMLVTRESTATNTGIVERGVTGVNESDLWLDAESTSVVNNTGIVERPIVGVNESDEMFPDNGTSSVVNIAEVIIPLLDSLEARATTFENREATQEILINLQKC